MSTELSIYDRFGDPLAAVKMLGESIAHSKLFNCENIHQGNVIAMECLVRRIPPLMLAQRYHLIKNKLSMQADAMLAEFDTVGKHRLIERSPERAEIELEIHDTKYRFALSWEVAQAEPFVYEGKEPEVVAALAAGRKPPIKPKYATPRARMQMLWARVVSDAVTAIFPGAKNGCYTPEEVDDFQGGPSALPATQDAPFDATPAEPAGQVVDAEYAVAEEPAEATPAPATENVGGMCSALLSTGIKRLFDEMGLTPEQRTAAIVRRNPQASTLRQLTEGQAGELYDSLRTKLAEVAAARIKSGLQAIEQEQPGITAKVIAKLKASGFAKFVDLPRDKALELLSAMAAPTKLEQYLGVAMWATPDTPPKN